MPPLPASFRYSDARIFRAEPSARKSGASRLEWEIYAPQQRGSGRADDQHLAGKLVQRLAQPREAPTSADITRLTVTEKQVIGTASAAVHPRFGIAVAGRTAKNHRPRMLVRSVTDLRSADIGTDAPQADVFTGIKIPRRRIAIRIFTGFR